MKLLRSVFSVAFSDITSGIALKDVWVELAKEDIEDQHKKTLLGPLWLLINYLLFAGTFIFVFRMGDGMEGYAEHVAIGLFVWLFMSEVISQSVQLFVKEQNFIKGTRLPLTVYVLRLTMQSVIRALYAMVGCLALLLFSGADVSEFWYLSVVGLTILLLITPAVIYVFAFAGAYFPDIQFLVSNVMRIGMFLTPVFWVYDNSSGIRYLLYSWNPFAYFIEVIRSPIVLGVFDKHSVLVCTAMLSAFWFLALVLLGRLKNRVVFVL